MNKLILKGRIASRDGVVLKYTQAGTAVASFTVAVDRRFSKDGEREADFINCVGWGKTAEFLANYFSKGQEILIEGRLQVRSFEGNDGQRKWVTEVVVEQVEFVGGKKSDSNNADASGVPSGGGYNAPGQLGLGEEIVFDDNDLPF